MSAQLDLLEPCISVAFSNADKFTDDFLAYLPDNLHVYAAFEREANKVVARGFQHYSARTIIEVLRHHSALAEVGGAYKLNDHYTPYLARLYCLLNPKEAHLFEFRVAKAVRKEMEAA